MTSTPAVRRLVAVAALAILPLAGASPPSSPAAARTATGAVSRTFGAEQAERPAVARLRGPITAAVPVLATGGARLKVAGTVVTKRGAVRKPRPVQLAERVGTRWVVVARSRSTKQGRFELVTSAGVVSATRVLRVQAPRANGLPPVQTPAATLSVLAAAEDWTYLIDEGARWDPCTPIKWTYNPAGQAYNALGDVTSAFAQIAAASGLTFQYVGTSQVVYLGDDDVLPDDSGIAVGWANAGQLSGLSGSVVGLGGAKGSSIAGKDVGWELRQGWVTLDNNDPFKPAAGFAAGGWGPVVLHETLHALGLGHAQLPRQLMYPVSGPTNATFGPGDLAGMAKIGLPAGCL